MATVVILREAEPPLEALADVLTASTKEGDPTIRRMVKAWKDSFAPTVSGRPGRGGLFNNPGEGLYVAWIRLNNPKQYNSYTTEMVKGVIAGFENSSVLNWTVSNAENAGISVIGAGSL